MESKSELSSKQCVPCRGDAVPLKGKELAAIHRKLGKEWEVINEHHIQKEFTFDNFKEALAFTNKLGALAEQEGHHPDILLSYGKAIVTLWTHKIDGLSESDFILAAKCDQIP